MRQFLFERCYSLGAGTLAIRTDDEALATRVEEIYGDCAVVDADPTLVCEVETLASEGVVRARFSHAFADLAEFLTSVFDGRGFAVRRDADEVFLMREGRPFAQVSDSALVVLRDDSWPSFVGNVAVNLLLRLQAEMLFFHAAANRIGGRAVMFTGAKRAGKTTTSLALAARGHALFGDEVTAIHAPSWSVFPFRRSVSIRNGVRAAAVDAALAHAPRVSEIFPDGEPRLRVSASAICGEAAGPAPLAAAFFLRSFAPSPEIEPVERTVASLRLLQPLGVTLWKNDGNRSTINLLRFFERTRCYYLDAGHPDDTAAAIERFLEETCP